MLKLNRWLEYLDHNRIRYSHSIHRRAETALETAAAERIPAHELAKTVVYAADNGFGIVVVPADEMVNLPEVARLLGSTCMRLADEGELAEIFPDCELGAMPPFGHPHNLPVLLDAGLA